MSEERIVRSGFRSAKSRQEWTDIFIQESLRDELRSMASRYTRLRGAVINYLESKGLENEGGYLIRLEREVGRQR